ncbi:Pentalenolactone D synthase [Cyphellophora attinorum]|uniref:Pentalenolactone D synthase n=1 Tax=Cyphellophora attinorum TaxID=1664694 RepID=A0A0N1H6V4_9EURO|nr:Pentalenolactone D synthase [Phialophora attinorum]KPI38134.1 Pentalenolactone D synthase [Phialophora attinorum]
MALHDTNAATGIARQPSHIFKNNRSCDQSGSVPVTTRRRIVHLHGNTYHHDRQEPDSPKCGSSGPEPLEEFLDAKIPTSKSLPGISFDPKALKRRYVEERDKRLREAKTLGGLDQFQLVETNGPFADYLQDPWADRAFNRAPVTEDLDVLILGGGYSAQIVASKLLMRGVSNFKLVDKAGDFGGTWYWNRFPGAQCDIESYIYMPLLEETGYMPTEKYARGKELLAHAERLGRHYGLYPKALFQTEVQSMHWNEQELLWTIKTNKNDKIRAKFVIPCAGPLHRPKLPGIPGMDRFKGKAFHSSRWDYDYTGGDSAGTLYRLRDKRVGIIGTGATAVQIVPHLAEWSKELYVFQRTPCSVGVRGNKPTDPAWAESLKPGWQAHRTVNFNNLCNGMPEEQDLINDGWTDLLPDIFGQQNPDLSPDEAAAARQLIDYQKMESVRARVDREIENPRTAESLKHAFNRPNVYLIDTKGKSLNGVDETGVLANGEHYPVDVLVYATGFEHSTSFSHRANLEIYGRNGVSLTEAWKEGPRTMHGWSARNFPNCFFIHNIQATLTPNFIHAASETATQLAYVVSECQSRGIKSIEPLAEAEEAWVNTIVDLATKRLQFLAECTPGYYNNEGEVNLLAARESGYGGGAPAFMKLMSEWRDDGSMKGMELKF